LARTAARFAEPRVWWSRPRLAVADGALGFWKALGELWPTTREQRCWVHKTANVLNKLPKSQQPKAKRSLQEIWMAETSKDAEAAFDAFIAAYQLKYDKAAQCLAKDRQALLAFYDFPAEHWKHLRTSNPIESTFATVRHRTIRSKGCLSNKTALAMVFKLVDAAQKSWRRLDGHNQLPKLIQGVRFTDGIEVAANPASPSNPKPPPPEPSGPSPRFGDSSGTDAPSRRGADRFVPLTQRLHRLRCRRAGTRTQQTKPITVRPPPRRLRSEKNSAAKQILRRIGHTRRYEPLPTGLRAMTALLVLRNKAIKPLLAAVQPLRPPRGAHNPKPIDAHYHAIRVAMQGVFHELGLAA